MEGSYIYPDAIQYFYFVCAFSSFFGESFGTFLFISEQKQHTLICVCQRWGRICLFFREHLVSLLSQRFFVCIPITIYHKLSGDEVPLNVHSVLGPTVFQRTLLGGCCVPGLIIRWIKLKPKITPHRLA